MSRDIYEPYIFVIDTEEYAGNFERPMCAYCTGQYGECGIGDEEAKAFKEEFPQWYNKFYNIIMNLPDHNGCHRPVTIYPTPGFFNDGIGNHYPDSKKGTTEVQQKFIEDCKERGTFITRVPGDFPAYQSVAIFFKEEPTQDMIDFMIEQAGKFKRDYYFSGNYKNCTNVPIIGFRLLKETVHTEQLGQW